MKKDNNKLDGNQLLFYLDALYEFANEVSRQRSVAEIMGSILNIVIGTFGIKKGLALVCYPNNVKFDIVASRNLDSYILQEISQKLGKEIRDDLGNMDGLSPISDLWEPEKEQISIRGIMVEADMKSLIIIHIQGRLTVCIGIGQLILGLELSEPQIELLSALITQTKVALGNALFYQDIIEENQRLKNALQKQYQFDDMVGQSEKMQEIYQCIQRVAEYPNYSVLIYGESGTGKELVAKAIHAHSPRKNRKYLPINCVALPHELVESELFGYEKGAFTGASKSKIGLFETANGGTMFLDEIAEMPFSIQAKLLRVLEQKEIMPIGGSKLRLVDVRVISATNINPQKAIAEGKLRDDLFYRFDIHIQIPPLRDRKEDIPLLVNSFLAGIANENGTPVKEMSLQGLKVLMEYDWPGNVRELKKVLMQATMLTQGKIINSENILIPHDDIQAIINSELSLSDSVNKLKRTMIQKALDENKGNRTKAASKLGLTRQNLRNMMQRMNIN